MLVRMVANIGAGIVPGGITRSNVPLYPSTKTKVSTPRDVNK